MTGRGARQVGGEGVGLARRPLGRTGLELTELGLGCGPLGGAYGPVDHDQAVATVRAALDAGVSHLDTAPLYGLGRSELLLGHAVRERPRASYLLSTKVGRYLRPYRPGEAREGGRPGLPFRAVTDYGREGTLRSLEQSLLRLGIERVDIALVHDLDAHAHGSAEAAEAALREALAGAFPTLRELRDLGVVGAIGVGVNEPRWAIRILHETDLDCVMIAGRLTPLNREAETELVPECAARGVGVLAAGPFNGGLLARGPSDAPRFNYRPAPPAVLERLSALEALAKRHGISLRAAALQHALRLPAVTCVVTGAMRPEEVRANVAALAAPVGDAFWDELGRTL